MKKTIKFFAALIFISGLFLFSFLNGAEKLSFSSFDLFIRENITGKVKVSANSPIVEYFDLDSSEKILFVENEPDFTVSLVQTRQKGTYDSYSEQTLDFILSGNKNRPDLPESFKMLNFDAFWKGDVDKVTAFGLDVTFVTEQEYFSLVKGTFPDQFEIQLLETCWECGRIESENEILIEPVQSIDLVRRPIQIDDQSPLSKNFNPQNYPLSFSLVFEKNSNLNFIDSKIQDLTEKFESKTLDRNKLVSFGFGGTAVASKQIFYLIEDEGIDYPWENIKNIGQNLDYFMVDTEMSVFEDCIVNLYTNTYCVTPNILEGYKNAGVNFVNISNDHVMDFGEDYFEETKGNFSTFGIQPVGNPDPDFSEPIILEKDGIKFGIISFNITERGLNISNLERVENLVSEADFTFVYLHEIADYLDETSQNTKSIVEEVGELGVDFVLVNGSHTVKPVSDDRTVYYGLGNLIFNQLQSESVRESIIPQFIFYDGKLIQISENRFRYDVGFVPELNS